MSAPDAGGARSVAKVVRAVRTPEGDGFEVRRVFPTPALADLDPFLLLDEMGPLDLAPGDTSGFPDHPHRGFETVTYLLTGRMRHRDSRGNEGFLGPGDVQWMTAGDGVVHSEMPDPELARRGGRLHGFQLWVNLPRQDKRIAPRYQEVPAAHIPVSTTPDGAVTARVIAGEALGASARVDTRTPILYLHLTLRPGARIAAPVPRDFHALVHVFEGAARVGRDGRPVADGEAAILAPDGDAAEIAVPADAQRPAEVLLVAGRPLGEPVARYGPFVMNTRDEILEAVRDYESGRLGAIAP